MIDLTTPRELAAQRVDPERIRVGVSACLLGQPVRFDRGHKRSRYVTDHLARFVELVPLCPEMAVGMGSPRPTIRLVSRDGEVRLQGSRDPGLDVTGSMRRYGREVAQAGAALSGMILKKGSPSCGMERVKVYSETGMPVGQSAGLFAGELMAGNPLLPVEEEGRLNDPVLREAFLLRVYTLHRWQCLVAGGLTARALVDFHTEHKLLVMAHDQQAYRRLGRLVAQAGSRPLEELADAYITDLMQALARHARPGHHANVLHHLLGYLKRRLDGGDRRELVARIEEYRRGLVPLVVPLTLLAHHLRRHPDAYLARQRYLQPLPGELLLRAHA